MSNPNITATDKDGNELSDRQIEINGIVPGEGGGDEGYFVLDNGTLVPVGEVDVVDLSGVSVDASEFAETAADVDAIPTAEKGTADGVATLDSGGELSDAELPPVATSVFGRDGDVEAQAGDYSDHYAPLEEGVARGPIADRPDTGPYDDYLYKATDQGVTWRWDSGTSDWSVFGHGSESQPVPEGHYGSVRTGGLNNDQGNPWASFENAGYSEGDFVPLLSLSPYEGDRITTTSTSWADDPKTMNINLRWDLVAPTDATTQVAFTYGVFPGTDESVDVRLRNRSDGETIVEEAGVTSSKLATLGPVDYAPSNITNTNNYRPQIQTDPGNNSSDIRQMIVIFGIQL